MDNVYGQDAEFKYDAPQPELAERVKKSLLAAHIRDVKRITTVTSWIGTTLVFLRFSDGSVLVKVMNRDFEIIADCPIGAEKAELFKEI